MTNTDKSEGAQRPQWRQYEGVRWFRGTDYDALLAKRDHYKERAERAEWVLLELADLMDAVYEGEYTPDSFTTQSARATLAQIDAERKTVFDSVNREEWKSMEEHYSNPSVGKPRTFAEGDSQ
jgi:hypothetical protein